MWEQQLANPIRFFQMRVARKHKAVDAKRGVFVDSRGDRRTIAHQRRSGTAAH
ncbi:Uncharacterised protein [Shigella sonnei]|nr:Uncharacterised protein [Shigella sonnei]